MISNSRADFFPEQEGNTKLIMALSGNQAVQVFNNDKYFYFYNFYESYDSNKDF